MIVDRILKIIELKGISKSKFYKETGLSNGFLDKVKDVGASKIEYILNSYPDISPNWLLTGEGEMLRESKDRLVAERTNSFSMVVKQEKVLPVLDPEVVGGTGNHVFGFEEKDIKAYYTIPEFSNRGCDFIIPLTGHSMEPSFMPGDKLACKIITEASFIDWGKPFVIATRDQGMILKRLRKSENEDNYLMVSDNPFYDPFEVPKIEVNGIALVLGIVRVE